MIYPETPAVWNGVKRFSCLSGVLFSQPDAACCPATIHRHDPAGVDGGFVSFAAFAFVAQFSRCRYWCSRRFAVSDSLSANGILSDRYVGLNMAGLFRFEKGLTTSGVPVRRLLGELASYYREKAAGWHVARERIRRLRMICWRKRRI